MWLLEGTEGAGEKQGSSEEAAAAIQVRHDGSLDLVGGVEEVRSG